MRRSLRLTLILSHLSLVVLAMGVAGLLLLTFLGRYFEEAAEESLAAQARITAQTLIPGALTIGPSGEDEDAEAQSPLANTLQQRQSRNLALQTENLALPGAVTPGDLDLSYLENTSLQLGAQLETRIRVLDVAGTVWVDSAPEAASSAADQEQNGELVSEALTGRYASRSFGAGRDSVMAVAMPILVENELVGVAYLTQPLRDVNAILNDLRSRWLWSTAIALIASGIVGLALSRAITRPLAHLTIAAGAVAQGHFEDAAISQSGAGEVGRLSRAFNDMTSRLRAARQMQATFVANVSHELRTPLTTIKGMVETLRDGAVEDVAVRDRFLETVEGETDRLIRLVNDLMVLTRADSEALNLRREPLDMAELARATRERLAPQAAERDVTLNIEMAPDAPLAWADGDRVAQVLVNLLDNAIKYSQPGSAVTVQIGAGKAPGDASPDDAPPVLVQVQDTGIGIPADDLPQIGQRFYRADKARARDRGRGGSGLGLSIAVALVEAHGGRLWVESEEGAGTTASFTLPGA